MVQIKLPPLRERKADIPLLVSAFLEKFSDPARPIRTISEDAMTRIMAYDWPGNIRELENAIERAVAMGSGPILHVGDLPSNLQYTSRGKSIPMGTNWCRSTRSSAARFSAPCGKPPETNWPPRGFSASARPRFTANSSNMNPGAGADLNQHPRLGRTQSENWDENSVQSRAFSSIAVLICGPKAQGWRTKRLTLSVRTSQEKPLRPASSISRNRRLEMTVKGWGLTRFWPYPNRSGGNRNIGIVPSLSMKELFGDQLRDN